jgi:hypothetical protein
MNFEITLNYNEKDQEYYAKNNRLAYYTCYFGGDYNYSKLVPPIPSNNYDCFFLQITLEYIMNYRIQNGS